MRAIAAMSSDRVIGYKGGLPWKPIPQDFQWFKQQTLGHNLVMGNSTFQSVGELRNRYTYILTNDASKYGNFWPAKRHQYIGLDDLMKLRNPYWDLNTWVCGGAKVYSLLLPYCHEVFITHVMGDYEGDTYMPPFEDQFPNSEIVQEHKDFWIVRYWR